MNEEKFSGKAAVYEKYRPGYPDAFLEYLYTVAGLQADSVIADIGSGTGKLTASLLRHGSTVYGVEPNGDMRRVAQQRLSCYDRFYSVEALAEHTGLPEKSVDFITVAQAFHWFDRAAFQRECQRILKNGGRVVLVWNSRDRKSELVQANARLNARCCPRFRGFSGGMEEDSPEAFRDFFQNGQCDYQEFRYDLSFDEEGFIGRNLSASYAPKEKEAGYQPYLLELKRLFQRYSSNQLLLMPNITRSYIGFV